MSKKPIKYQNIHKIAELLAEDPNMSHDEIAERIGSTVNSVKQNRFYLNGAGGDPVKAILQRNGVSLRLHIARTAREAASPNYRKPAVEIEGSTFFHKIAKLDATLPKLNAREAAKLIGSTTNSVKQHRSELAAANGDPDMAAQVNSKKSAEKAAQRTKDAAKWRAQEEWKASGIDL